MDALPILTLVLAVIVVGVAVALLRRPTDLLRKLNVYLVALLALMLLLSLQGS
ncbi:hypothetical protein [Alteriqipengyuania sp. 357]